MRSFTGPVLADTHEGTPTRLRRHVVVLDRRIAEATVAKELIEHALACPLPFGQCPHARAQIEARIPAEPA